MCELLTREITDFDRWGDAFVIPRMDDALSFYDDRWLCAWAQAFLPNQGWSGPLTAYLVGSGTASLGSIVLARQTVSRLHVRSLAGYYWPFRTLVVRDDADSRKTFATSIAAHFSKCPPATVLRFGPVSSSDKAFQELLRALMGTGWVALRHDDGQTFVLNLPEDASILEKTISHSLLKNARYCRRRMEKQLGSLLIERHVLREGSTEALEVAAAIEAASWVGKKSGDLKFVGVENRMFWTSLASKSGSPFDIVIWLLHCDNAPIAFSAHIETRETIYIIANSYDEQWRSHSPGSVLSLELLGDACRRGKKRVDWGQGDSGYKSRWGAAASACLFDVMLFRPGIRGHVLCALVRRLRPEWRRLDNA
ncbi:MAG: GNAT family N-acetyltransferase [Rhodanobacteraceae bacterium]|nr:MAG: GNAT family N-acetyltransferase [Rhodanobacteraceae bacterium]